MELLCVCVFLVDEELVAYAIVIDELILVCVVNK